MTMTEPARPAAAPEARSQGGVSSTWRWHVIRAILARDFLGYFSNPAGYVFTALFVAIAAFATVGLPEFFANNLASLDTLNRWMPYLLLFFVPAVTMNIWAEERKQGTEELLLTLPARDVEVVLGKYLAALGIYSVSLVFLMLGLLVIFLVFPGLGRPDLGVFLATFLGYWLMGAMLIAFGMVASGLSSSVTVAFILGGLLCAIPVFGDLIGSMLSGLGRPGESLGRMVSALSIPEQFRDFGSGVVRYSSVLYFVGGAAAMLYLNMVLLGRRHWAGGERSRGLWLHYLARFVAVIVALASLTSVVAHAGLRTDVSAERINTLSAESKRLIREVPADRPVFIEAYVSPEVPREYVQVKRDLVNLLREIEALGGDRVRLNLVEAARYSPEAREAESRFGITPRRVLTVNEARQGTEDILLGVAFSSGAERVVVPFFDRGLPVEYELIRSLRVVSGSERKKVGVLQTDAKLLGGFDFAMRSPSAEWEIVTELKKQYEVSSVSADQTIPTDLDALIVAQPSSLTPSQAENLTAYVQAGGPALLFVDPIVTDDPTLAPSEPRMPAGGPFGGAPPTEPKADLTPLMDLLDVSWPIDEVVWNPYNPHPSLDYLDPEILFIGEGSDAPGGAFGRDPVSQGLQEVVLLYPGLLRSKGTRLDLEFEPLMRTNDQGGVLNYRDILTPGLMGIPQLNRRRPYVPSGQSYVTAARVRGPAAGTTPAAAGEEPAKAGASLNVVLVADLDMISDQFFAMRRKPAESLDQLNFDNVTFVLNCVDSLAGDDSFIALRKRRPVHRTLEAIERETRRFVEASQEATRQADEAAKAKLADAQARLDKAVEEVRQREDMDPRTKEILLDQQQRLENRRLEVEKANIEAEAERLKEQSAARELQGIRGIHSRAKVLAVLIPPLPVLLLGLVVFFVRHGRENRGANPNRLA